MTKKILFSLDVLTDSSHRESHRTNGDWDAYSDAFSDDEPNTAIIELLNCLAEFYDCIVYSDMNENSRQQIIDWLVDNNVNAEDVLLSNVRGSLVSKKMDAISEVIDEVEFVWESSLMMVEQLRERNVTVFECLG